METISVRYEASFVADMEKIMKDNRYSTKAEFIRQAIRDKMRELETKSALQRLEKAYGAGSHKKITKDGIDKAGMKAIEEINRKL